jgi:outer membrane protein assembly factor BamA
MQRFYKYLFAIIIASLSVATVNAQPQFGQPAEDSSAAVASFMKNAPSSSNTIFTVRNIFITGNKKTKESIILRELLFKKDEQYTLKELVSKFELSKSFLMNTALFHEAVISLKGFEGNEIDVLVEVSERWYIFPLPYLKPVDRNLNQWLFEQHARLDRTNYGAKILYNNITGRNDKLRLTFVTGYTKQASFSYEKPFIDNKMRWGLKVSAAAGKTREVNYSTLNNKQQFLKDNDNYLYHFSRAGFEITYRKAIRTRHRFGFNYVTEKVKDTVVALNSSYYPAERNGIAYPEFYYTLQYFDLDYIPYPTKGHALELSLYKKGVNQDINLWQLSAKISANWPLSPKTFFNVRGFAALKLPFKQPFTNQQMLGYNDSYIQGYEYYVIDGVAGAYVKASFTKELFRWNIGLRSTKLAVNKRIPFRFYGKVFGNAGYVHHPESKKNLLSNRLLSSAGVGIDILTFYDFVLKLEWSFNQLGQNGLFLHRRTTF